MKGACILVVSLTCSLAWAGSFDPSTGRVRLGTGTVATSLDGVDALGGPQLVPALFDASDARVVGAAATPYFVGEAMALEGKGALSVGGVIPFLYVYPGPEAAALIG